jgi:hypothetical protein
VLAHNTLPNRSRSCTMLVTFSWAGSMEPQMQPSKPITILKRVLREVFAFTLWIYLVTKVFVFDFDVYLIETYVPSLSWLVRFKFLLFLVLTSVYWISVGDKNFGKSLLFILFYPFILIFWRVPKLFIGNWFAILGAIGIGFTFVRSLKRNFVVFTLIALSCVLILVSNEFLFLVLSIVNLSTTLLLHFSKRFYYSFVPSKALFLPKQAAIQMLEKSKSNLRLPDEIRTTAIEHLTDEQRTRWSNTLQTMLLVNRLSHYVASKLRELQERRLVILYFIFGLLFSFFLTIIVFALDNYALHKIDPTSFSDNSSKGLLFFLYYSFNTILNSSITDFFPMSAVARLFHSVEVFLGLFLMVILFFVYINVKSDKTKTEVDDLVSTLDKQGKDLEVLINREFSMDIDQAIDVVEKLPGSLLKLFYFITTKRKP